MHNLQLERKQDDFYVNFGQCMSNLSKEFSFEKSQIQRQLRGSKIDLYETCHSQENPLKQTSTRTKRQSTESALNRVSPLLEAQVRATGFVVGCFINMEGAFNNTHKL